MKRLVFLLTLLSVFLFAGAQDIILEKNVEEQYKGTKGPNMRHFKHLYLGFGAIIDYDEEAGNKIDPWKSSQFIVGYRYKLKLMSFYALGIDLNFKMNQYMLEGDDVNPLDLNNPLAMIEGEEKHFLLNNGLGMEVFQRINIGKRGNTLGNYIDAGVHAQWNMTDVEDYQLISDDDPFIGKSRVVNRRLTYVEPFSYGLSARIGLNKYIISGYYRLNDHFKSEFDIPEMPRLNIGIQFALF